MATTTSKRKPKTKRKRRLQPLPTLWEIPDPLWARIEPILREFWPQKPTGRRVANWRKMLNGIIFRMRTGCQWDQLPEKFGPKSTVHGWFQRWCEGGVMQRIWAVLVEDCDELGAVDWQWQSADAWLGKARFGGEKDGQESHRPRQERDQEEPADRRRRRPTGCRDRWGQRRRAEAPEGGGQARGATADSAAETEQVAARGEGGAPRGPLPRGAFSLNAECGIRNAELKG